MRYLELGDFTRQANKLDIFSSIAEFKIPKGMVYAFSSRQNMSIFVQELTALTGDGSNKAFALSSDAVQCADLGGAETEGEDQEDQIVAYVDGTRDDAWTMDWDSMVITFDTAPGNLEEVNIFYCSTLAGSTSVRSDILEIRAEAPAGQNLGIPIFSGTLRDIMEGEQNSDLAPLRLQSAVLLPEGFVLAVKVNAGAAALAGDEEIVADGDVFSDLATAAERTRIPYERLPLARFPRDFKAKILASMAVS